MDRGKLLQLDDSLGHFGKKKNTFTQKKIDNTKHKLLEGLEFKIQVWLHFYIKEAQLSHCHVFPHWHHIKLWTFYNHLLLREPNINMMEDICMQSERKKLLGVVIQGKIIHMLPVLMELTCVHVWWIWCDMIRVHCLIWFTKWSAIFFFFFF